ncbi:MAG: peptidase MA family metallohydrolase, partial [Candidatus Promineifilaceae bacterium]
NLIVRPYLSTNNYNFNFPFTPGTTISVTQPMPATTLDLQPFATVNYSWEGITDDGQSTLAQDKFVYEDDRFYWHRMPRPPFTAHWTEGGPDFGQTVIDTAEVTMEYLNALLPQDSDQPIDIYVYPSSAELRSALISAGHAAEMSGPRALGVALVTAVNEQTAADELKQTVPYELAQLFLSRSAGEEIERLPWWLKEGIAMSARQQASPHQENLLADAVQQGDTIPLWRLCVTPQDSGERAELAAAESASLIAYLLKERPPGTIASLWNAYLSGDDCAAGVQHVLGQTLDDLEADWLTSLSRSSTGAGSWRDKGVWLLLLAGGTFLVLLLTRLTLSRSIGEPR